MANINQIATFILLRPLIEKDGYKRVVVVFLRETDRAHATASVMAVPLFKKIARKMLIHEHVL